MKVDIQLRKFNYNCFTIALPYELYVISFLIVFPQIDIQLYESEYNCSTMRQLVIPGDGSPCCLGTLACLSHQSADFGKLFF